MKNSLPHILLFISFLFFANSAISQEKYSFFVAGHTYGQPGVNNIGFYPPFKNKFDYLKSRPEIVFGILTGDIVSPNPTAQDWDEIDADIAELGLPVYFAAGNHDMENRPLFESRYGATYFSFIYENDLFIILDPNIDHWNISGSQFSFLQNTISENFQTVDNIFVFFHQELWWTSNNIYKGVTPNSFADKAPVINFWSEIEPLFHYLPNEVVMFAGDFGAGSWSADLMYDNYDNITLIGSGMGDGVDDGDNFIIVNVNQDKKIAYDLICLSDTLNCLGELTDYRITPIPPTNPEAQIILYPNPVTDFITIDIKVNKYMPVEMTLTDFIGRVKKTSEFNLTEESKLQFDLTGLDAGIYFMKIIIGRDFIVTGKIVKMN